MTRKTIRLGTRGSTLARWQTDYVMSELRRQFPDVIYEIVIFTTKGDRVLDTSLPMIGGKGLFTAELEAALNEGKIDLAVHSLKDLPTENPDGLTVGAILQRANPADVLVTYDNVQLNDLPMGSIIGTSSRRRAAQLLHHRPDLEITDIRGNVETRLRKVRADDANYDATMLAYAGLDRLGLLDEVSQILPFDMMLPAPGQGALAVQCRDENEILNLLNAINDSQTYAEVEAERAFLAGLGGGCSVPIAAYATFDGDSLNLRGRVSSIDGSQQIDIEKSVSIQLQSPNAISLAHQLGQDMAAEALQQGAAKLLEVMDEG